MDQQPHRMTLDADNGDEVLLTCSEPDCRRQVVLRRRGGLVVLHRGDFFTEHIGGRGVDISPPTAA